MMTDYQKLIEIEREHKGFSSFWNVVLANYILIKTRARELLCSNCIYCCRMCYNDENYMKVYSDKGGWNNKYGCRNYTCTLYLCDGLEEFFKMHPITRLTDLVKKVFTNNVDLTLEEFIIYTRQFKEAYDIYKVWIDGSGDSVYYLENTIKVLYEIYEFAGKRGLDSLKYRDAHIGSLFYKMGEFKPEKIPDRIFNQFEKAKVFDELTLYICEELVK